MQERYISTVDFGTAKIALSVVKVCGEDIQVIYYRETPSEGVRYDMVFAPLRAAEALKKAIREAEEELGIKISQLVTGLPRYKVQEYHGEASAKRSDESSCITKEEIEILKDMALNDFNMQEYAKAEIYGAEAQSFNIDDSFQSPEEDIIGVPSSTIEGNFKVFLGAKKGLDNLDMVMNNAGIAIARKYFMPPLTARAVLTQEEMDNGVALVEMGAGVTSLTIYRGKILRHYSAVPFGGRNITDDIKYECGYRRELSENIKMAYGACLPDKLQNMAEKTIQVVDEEGCCYPDLTVRYLSEIVTERCREIFEAILYSIQESGYADKIRNGIVLTGGGAELTNCASLMREMSGYNVRIGYPRIKRLSNYTNELCKTSAAATVGMIFCGAEDEGLKCTDGLETAETVETPADGKIQESQQDEENTDLKGTVFEKSDSTVKPRRTGKKGHKIWTKFTAGIKGGLDSTVGNLYDGMKEE